jgi:hypothetical protein
MKTPVRHFINHFGLMFLFLLAAVVWNIGCAGFVHHSDPLAGWNVDFDHQPDQVIVIDYQDYIQKLPAKQREAAYIKHFYKDGTGQHAVQIEVGINGIVNGTWREHVLIYNKDDKRVKVMKYANGHYSLW